MTRVTVEAEDGGRWTPVSISTAATDWDQAGWTPAGVLDDKPETGWGVVGRRAGRPVSLLLVFAEPRRFAGARDFRVRIAHGSRTRPKHTLGRLRLAFSATPAPERAFVGRARLAERVEAFLSGGVKTLVTERAPAREVRVLPRGDWRDSTGEVALPAVPAVLPPLAASGRADRRDLARWLCSRENPLTARVLANRLWALFMGQGIARSLDDFGLGGDRPSHPRLLDALAADLVDSGWDVKRLIRRIVLSRAYRRSSAPPEKTATLDPDRRLFSHQGARRLTAEMIRDNALAAGGLLDLARDGAAPVFYQPGTGPQAADPPAESAGVRTYWRSVYLYRKRGAPHPMLSAFDAPSREHGVVQRRRTDTPLQALALLNDPVLVEAARALASRAGREAPGETSERLAWTFREVLSREPRPDELERCAALLEKHRGQYRADPAAARRLAGLGWSRPGAGEDSVELASWTSVTRALLGLHETVTRF